MRAILRLVAIDPMQATFNNLVGGSRFKMIKGGRLSARRCPNAGCGNPDSWRHFLDCYGVLDMGKRDRRHRGDSIGALCRRIKVGDPQRPTSPGAGPHL